MEKKQKARDDLINDFVTAVEPFMDHTTAYSVAREAQVGAMLGLLVKKNIVTQDEYNEVLEGFLTSLAISMGTVDPENEYGDEDEDE